MPFLLDWARATEAGPEIEPVRNQKVKEVFALITARKVEEIGMPQRARRDVADESVSQRVLTGLERCAACGSRLVRVRVASGHRYYRCAGLTKGPARDAACRALVRAPG